MTRRSSVVALLVGGLLLAGVGIAKLNETPSFQMGEMVKHDLSLPLSELKAAPAPKPFDAEPAVDGDSAPQREGDEQEAAVEAARRAAIPALRGTPAAVDRVAQTKRVVGGPKMPTPTRNWDGIGVNGWIPADTSMDVGDTQVVETVNTQIQIWTKNDGVTVLGPSDINVLFAGFGGLCQNTNDGDATVVFDRLAKRWVISQFAVTGANGSSIPYLQCVAVSTTSSALSAYNRYAFAYTQFPDYPKLSVWPDAYYTTFNMFSGNRFAGAMVCAYDRAAMLAGNAANQACSTPSSSYSSILVASVEGTTAPAAGTAAYGLSVYATTYMMGWRYSPNFATKTLSVTGPGQIAVSTLAGACSASGGCVPQFGTTQKLDSLGSRLMYRYVYRKIGSQESLLAAHAVTSNSVTGIRWYELRPSASSQPTVYQQGTYQPDAGHRWIPSISMDRVGNIGMVYSLSATNAYPQIAITGRQSNTTQPLGIMSETESSLVTSPSPQTGGSRWGDYAAAVVDPSDDCTFWVATEYNLGGGTSWSTKIANFAYPTCTSTLTNAAPSITSQPASITVKAGATAAFTATASGLPAPVYQWKRSNDGGISWTNVGTNASSYTTSGTTASDNNARFMVTVSNSLASVNSTIATLTVNSAAAVPDPVTNLNATSPSKGVLSASWTAPAATGGSAVTYTIELYNASGTKLQTKTGVSGTSTSFSGLTSRASYYVMVYAVNSTGSSTSKTSAQVAIK